MQSSSEAFMPAFASAWRDARRASVTPVSPSDTQCRVLIPERGVIHSSEVSMIADRSSFVTTRSGTWNPVAMNSVRGIRVPCEKGAPAEDLPPTRGLAREFMDLTVTRAQYDAVRGARHLPDERRRTARSEEHTSELQSLAYLVCRLLLEKKKKKKKRQH